MSDGALEHQAYRLASWLAVPLLHLAIVSHCVLPPLESEPSNLIRDMFQLRLGSCVIWPNLVQCGLKYRHFAHSSVHVILPVLWCMHHLFFHHQHHNPTIYLSIQPFIYHHVLLSTQRFRPCLTWHYTLSFCFFVPFVFLCFCVCCVFYCAASADSCSSLWWFSLEPAGHM